MVTLMDAETQHILVSLARGADGAFVTATPSRGYPVIPRKCSNCQHVIGSGEVVCLQRGIRSGGTEEVALAMSAW